MTSKRRVAAAAALVALTQLAGCLPREEGIYRGGVLIRPGNPLALGDRYEFTFLDKWRISHAWLSGLPEIEYCWYSRKDKKTSLDRFVEIDGQLKVERVADAGDRYGQKYVSNPSRLVYGTDRDGKFVGYLPFCGHSFVDIRVNVTVALIKPDPAHGTDQMVTGAKRVTLNGLTWLHQSAQVKDEVAVAREGNALIERWVLQIPDSPYWLVMGIGGFRSSDGKGPGIDRDPEKYARLLDLFHFMVMSVQLEPISAPAGSLRSGSTLPNAER